MKINRFLLTLAISLSLSACNPPSSVENKDSVASVAKSEISKPKPPPEIANDCVFSLGFDAWEPTYTSISAVRSSVWM